MAKMRQAGTKLIIKPKKPQSDDHELDNQLWTFENGYLVSKKTSFGMKIYAFMDIEGGDLRSDKKVLQYSRKKTMAHNQRWGIRDGFIYAVADPSLVLEHQENDDEVHVSRKTEDGKHQQWNIQLYEGDY
ncbi:hypothetical protein [Parasitella parasitica]|uniref:Ricin B lectin domain-containing protein n=1 Tax=Parasitella parasitica TaxID=35722 RepID=A0A0B7MPE7_9FUNG|nr:hypothetical protein [Parasitella parasitica]